MRKEPVSKDAIRRIIEACASVCRLSPRQILSSARLRTYVAARIAAAVMLRDAGLSLKQIGRRLGYRHHATVLGYLKRAARGHRTAAMIVERAKRLIEKPPAPAPRQTTVADRPPTSPPRPTIIHPSACREPGCVMPAGPSGYCRHHWAMITDPGAFRSRETTYSGSIVLGGRRISLSKPPG